jgi:hypothetical protein
MGEKSCEWVLGMRWRMEEKRLRRKAGTAGWRLRADECPDKSSVHAIIISQKTELFITTTSRTLNPVTLNDFRSSVTW